MLSLLPPHRFIYAAAKEDMSLSIIGKRHNLDLMLNSQEKRDEWVDSLQKIVNASR